MDIDAVRRGASIDSGVAVEYLATFAQDILDVSHRGERLRRDDLDRYEAIGAQAASDGIGLPALLDLYLSAAWRLWEAVAAKPQRFSASSLATMAGGMFRASDDVAEILATGYQSTQRNAMRLEESARREFIDDLLNGGAQPERLNSAAERFGYNLAGVHHVIVASTDRPLVDAGPVHRRVEAGFATTAAKGDVLAATKDGLLVCIVPGDSDAADTALLRILSDSGDGPWTLGVGRADNGPGGIVRSYREARVALDIESRLDRGVTVARFDRLLPYRVITNDLPLCAELVESVLGPLAGARGGIDAMVETLQALFAAGGNHSATARALHLSTRAVTYRLERIAALTGLAPDDPDDRFVLELAVRARPLVGLRR